MSIHFLKKSQEKSLEVRAYEEENFGTPWQYSIQVEPQQAMAIRGCDRLVFDSVECPGYRNRRHSVSLSDHHQHSTGFNRRSAERNAEPECGDEHFSPADHLAAGVDQPDESICQRNTGALHRPDVPDSQYQEQ